MSRPRIAAYLGIILLLFAGTAGWYAFAFTQQAVQHGPFDGDRALADVRAQVDFGPRTPGSDAHAREVAWLKEELGAAGWQVEEQSATSMGHAILNLVASRSSAAPQIILGAHYDSRLTADRDPLPSRRTQPVPGANDGASGVAVLLELARTLPADTPPMWLVFFDAEDNGNIAGWDWLLGSRAFVASMTVKPKAMILLDMVGDKDLSLPMEANSDPALRDSIWKTAESLGYRDIFVPHVKYTIEDDHLPFIEAGIPSVDIIDLDYAYWHTTSDTTDHVSAESLHIVGQVMWTWLTSQRNAPR